MTTTTTPCACWRCRPHWTDNAWLLGAVCVLGCGLIIYGFAIGEAQLALAEHAVRPPPTTFTEVARLWMGRAMRVVLTIVVAALTALNVWPLIAPQHYNRSYDYMLAQLPADRAAHERRVRAQSEFGR